MITTGNSNGFPSTAQNIFPAYWDTIGRISERVHVILLNWHRRHMLIQIPSRFKMLSNTIRFLQLCPKRCYQVHLWRFHPRIIFRFCGPGRSSNRTDFAILISQDNITFILYLHDSVPKSEQPHAECDWGRPPSLLGLLCFMMYLQRLSGFGQKKSNSSSHCFGFFLILYKLFHKKVLKFTQFQHFGVSG